jgi:MurNAc alpha-1-phosphate uridylyltransferase
MILAAGRGQRLSPLTDSAPKPLIKVGGKSLIEHQLIRLKSAGFHEVVINTGWLGQHIINSIGNGSRYGLHIEYSIEPEEGLETGGGIYQALPLLGDKPFIVVNADIYHDIPLEDLRLNGNALLKRNLLHLVLVENPEYHPQGDFCLDGCDLKMKSAKTSSTHGLANQHQTYTFSGIGLYRTELFATCDPGKFSSVPLIHSAIKDEVATGEYSRAAWFDAGTQERLEKIESFIRSTK